MRIATGEVTPTATTLVELLQRQAERYGDKVVFAYSDNGDEQGRIQISYAELDCKARAIGATLQGAGAAGQRVLVFCRDGFEHIAGLFGCWYAGAIAVPVHEKFPPRLSWVVPDVQPGFAVTSPQMTMNTMTSVDTLVQMVDSEPLRWALIGYGDADGWVPPELSPDATAMLMYTSGTTASPKAVVLSHRNIVGNVAAICRRVKNNEQTIGVSWMPHQHNMSLVAQLVAVVAAGATGVGFAPDVFTQRPMRWLELLSESRATATGAPYWAYTACLERSTPAERAKLDLSCLISAGGGGQTATAADMRAFTEAFAVAGLRPAALNTGYGLAEATSGVSSGTTADPPLVLRLDQVMLAEDRLLDVTPDHANAVEVVGAGPPLDGQLVAVVDPETLRECEADQLGEIWVAGVNVAQGYWRRPEETRATFGGYLADTGEGPFLRTGDVGFLRGGELFVTGRCRDLIDIGGSSYYPDSLEATVRAAHPALSSRRGAAFTVRSVADPEAQSDELVIVQEMERDRVDEADLGGIVEAVRAAVGARYGIEPASILLVSDGGLPTTAIGKIQRGRCRQLFTDRALPTLAEWHAGRPAHPNARHRGEATFWRDLEAAKARLEWESR